MLNPTFLMQGGGNSSGGIGLRSNGDEIRGVGGGGPGGFALLEM
jgi:hypothetical protein